MPDFDKEPMISSRTAMSNIGGNSHPAALTKLSRRMPSSFGFSRRSRCEAIMRANASAIGIAMIDLLMPTAATTSHSAIRIDEQTEAISHAANAGSPIRAHRTLEGTSVLAGGLKVGGLPD